MGVAYYIIVPALVEWWMAESGWRSSIRQKYPFPKIHKKYLLPRNTPSVHPSIATSYYIVMNQNQIQIWRCSTLNYCAVEMKISASTTVLPLYHFRLWWVWLISKQSYHMQFPNILSQAGMIWLVCVIISWISQFTSLLVKRLQQHELYRVPAKVEFTN